MCSIFWRTGCLFCTCSSPCSSPRRLVVFVPGVWFRNDATAGQRMSISQDGLHASPWIGVKRSWIGSWCYRSLHGPQKCQSSHFVWCDDVSICFMSYFHTILRRTQMKPGWLPWDGNIGIGQWVNTYGTVPGMKEGISTSYQDVQGPQAGDASSYVQQNCTDGGNSILNSPS